MCGHHLRLGELGRQPHSRAGRRHQRRNPHQGVGEPLAVVLMVAGPLSGDRPLRHVCVRARHHLAAAMALTGCATLPAITRDVLWD